MSKYTLELRYLIDQNFDLGMKSYQIFDENYRNILNDKIFRRYRYREIAFETPERFKHELNLMMELIMPKYNILYKQQKELLEKPHFMASYTETFEKEGESKQKNKNKSNSVDSEILKTTDTGNVSVQYTGNVTNTDKQFHVDSDTPAGLINTTDINNNFYASAAKRTNDENKEERNLRDSTTRNLTSRNENDKESAITGESENNLNSTENYVRVISGYRGTETNIELFKKLVDNIIDIDMKIIDDLKELFMGVF